MGFKGQLSARLDIEQYGSNEFGGPYASAYIAFLNSLVDGTGALAFDRAYVAQRTLASGATDSLDVAGGLTDALGNTITMAEIAAIMLVNAPRDLTVDVANTTDLTLFGGSNPFAGILGGTTPTITPIKPGGIVLLAAPAHASGIGAVVAGTGDILRIVNSAGAQNKYQIGILGRSA